MQNFTSAITYSSPDELTSESFRSFLIVPMSLKNVYWHISELTVYVSRYE